MWVDLRKFKTIRYISIKQLFLCCSWWWSTMRCVFTWIAVRLREWLFIAGQRNSPFHTTLGYLLEMQEAQGLISLRYIDIFYTYIVVFLCLVDTNMLFFVHRNRQKDRTRICLGQYLCADGPLITMLQSYNAWPHMSHLETFQYSAQLNHLCFPIHQPSRLQRQKTITFELSTFHYCKY